MSNLGSMARAAEYAAARAATARQVSRETEAQKLPPKSTPVSLSAFTKGQPTSRNKGNKAWKPLTTDDLGGDEDYSDNPTSREQTPFYPDNDEEPRSTRRLLARPTHGSMEELKIPTAPKAMLVQRDRPAVLLDPAPRRVSAQQAINYAHQQHPQAPDGTPGRGTQGRSLLHVPPFPYRPSRRQRSAYLHEMQLLGAHHDQADMIPAIPMFGHGLHAAAYLTPTRDEIAQVMQERDRQHMLNMINLQPGITQQPPSSFGVFDDSPVHYYNPGEYNPSGYGQVHPPSYEVTPPSYYPAQQSTTRHEMPPALHATPPNYQPMRSNVDQSSALYHPDYRKPDVAYDRARTLEAYKTSLAKQALEQKGKTVLHNPELHKPQEDQQNSTSSALVVSNEPDSEPSQLSFTPWQEVEDMLEESKKDQDAWNALAKAGMTVPEPDHNASKRCGVKIQSDAFAGNTTLALIGPPPGLELLIDGSGDFKHNGFREFPESFYALKPLTRTQVQRVRDLSQQARDDLAGTIRKPLKTTMDGEDINSVRAKFSKHWFYGLPPFEDVDGRNELAAKVHECAIKDKAIKPKSEEDMAADRAIIGNVIGNVKYYMDQCRLPEHKRSIPFKIKPVPEYATERPSVLTGGTSIFSSFFEEPSTKGEVEKPFIPTPKRIARDPRFRPATPKDGGKLKLEDERIARHASYGRRVL